MAGDSNELTGKTILFFVTEDWYFCSHRLGLAVAAQKAGANVVVVTRVSNHAAEIKSAGLDLVPIELSRRSKNPLVEIALMWRLARIYRKVRPDIVHHVAVKPVIYGSLVARMTRVPAIVNALAGLGFLFGSEKPVARILRPFVRLTLRMLLNAQNSRVIVQNEDDASVLEAQCSVAHDKIELIRGAGVDTEEFHAVPETNGKPRVILASRLLWAKGIREFVEAARILRQEGSDAEFVVVGEGDAENPESISNKAMQELVQDGSVVWWGKRSDMPEVFRQTHIVCLPTYYREGLPKVLLEAASCGRPIVTTDVPGCRDVVHDGVNGILVPAKDPMALASALSRLIESKDLRIKMGAAGRERISAEFSLGIVTDLTLQVYRSVSQP